MERGAEGKFLPVFSYLSLSLYHPFSSFPLLSHLDIFFSIRTDDLCLNVSKFFLSSLEEMLINFREKGWEREREKHR